MLALGRRSVIIASILLLVTVVHHRSAVKDRDNVLGFVDEFLFHDSIRGVTRRASARDNGFSAPTNE